MDIEGCSGQLSQASGTTSNPVPDGRMEMHRGSEARTSAPHPLLMDTQEPHSRVHCGGSSLALCTFDRWTVADGRGGELILGYRNLRGIVAAGFLAGLKRIRKNNPEDAKPSHSHRSNLDVFHF